MRARIGGEAESRLRSSVAEQLIKARQEQLLGQENSEPFDFENAFKQAEGGFIAENWEIFGKEYFAKIEWIKEDAGLGLTEAGTFKLYHKPG